MYRLVAVVITPSNVMENDDIFIPSERNKQMEYLLWVG